jgi:hypothetical protein
MMRLHMYVLESVSKTAEISPRHWLRVSWFDPNRRTRKTIVGKPGERGSIPDCFNAR